MAKYVLDTHVLVRFLTNSRQLGVEAKKALKDPKSEFYVLKNVFEEIRYKFEKFKKDNNSKGAIKIPPIICWLIIKKAKNAKICNMNDKEVINLLEKNKILRQIKRDDQPFVAKYLKLKEKYPRTEVKVITEDDNMRKNALIRTCW